MRINNTAKLRIFKKETINHTRNNQGENKLAAFTQKPRRLYTLDAMRLR